MTEPVIPSQRHRAYLTVRHIRLQTAIPTAFRSRSHGHIRILLPKAILRAFRTAIRTACQTAGRTEHPTAHPTAFQTVRRRASQDRSRTAFHTAVRSVTERLPEPVREDHRVTVQARAKAAERLIVPERTNPFQTGQAAEQAKDEIKANLSVLPAVSQQEPRHQWASARQ